VSLHRAPRTHRLAILFLPQGLTLVGILGLTLWHARHSTALREAEAAEAQGDDGTALHRALNELDRFPSDRRAALVTARCLSRLNFAEQAEPYYQRVGPLASKDLRLRIDALVRLGLALLAQDRLDEARGVAERLARIAEGTEAADALAGEIHHERDEPGPAVAAFEHVLKRDPELRSTPLPRDEIWAHLAEDLIKEHRPAAARRHLNRALSGREEHVFMDLLGQVAWEEGALDESERCWRQALAWNPFFAKSWLNLGRLALRRDRPADAVERLERTSELAPNSIEAAEHLALAYSRLGREDDARRQTEKVKVLRHRSARKPRGMGALADKPAS
jgi:tetratricopeptide (TPR) repeat protein